MNAFALIATDRKPYDHPDRVAIRQERAIRERMMRACVAFNDLEADEQHAFADRLASIMPAGQPVPPFTTYAAEAADWASWACTGELVAYAAGCLVRMPEGDRRGLLASLRRGAA